MRQVAPEKLGSNPTPTAIMKYKYEVKIVPELPNGMEPACRVLSETEVLFLIDISYRKDKTEKEIVSNLMQFTKGFVNPALIVKVLRNYQRNLL